MTPALEVIAPGVHTTVQDRGRVGFQDIGVPTSGPLDRMSLRLANALVGNDAGTEALELLVQGPTLRVLAGSVRVALVGCNASLEIRTPVPRQIPAGQSVKLARGEVFRVGALGDSLCAYLAIEGGLAVSTVLGSASTYVRGAIGGLHGRRLQRGDTIPLKLDSAAERRERTLATPLELALDQTIRVVMGPQAEYFTDAGVRTFFSSEYVVSHHADRMGYRLEGPTIEHAKGYNIVSDGIVTGSIQVPGSGKPIVLMVDNQSTGGYPKIATVISADIPVVGRRRPGRTVRFAAIDVLEAERARKRQEAAIVEMVQAIADAG
ncbi:MAG TPA: biotin-dependent carboxyltransferase family protein [Burkholderiales bacterium]|nr:biotin-dependent carboxyltransferase family protein [Burkholderiales bacterium]